MATCGSLVFIFALSLSFLQFHMSTGHPLCLDFNPPFIVAGGLSFCHEYSNYTCCTRNVDATIAAYYQRVVPMVTNATCATYLRTLLCLQCSPLAVHIYDAETTLVKKPFPGLCRNYCGDVYRTCPNIIPYVTNDSNILNAFRSGENNFCSAIKITDMAYCYPDVLHDPNTTRNYLTTDGCLCVKSFAKNLRNPVLLLSPDDGSGRIFVGEQLGLVSIFYKNGTRRNNVFLDITNIVLDSASPGDERGFLGMAFHPNFRSNQKFYVYFSIGRDGNFRNRISEFTTSANDPNVIDRSSERVLLEIDKPFSNHNGGQILFGIDGYFYIMTGDGGSGGDPFNNAQNLSTLLGKVLRIDVDRRTNGSAYGIPDSNPFLSNPRARPEVYAYGCRNMWRCSVDAGDPMTGYGRGRIFCGDVGQARWEEVDIITSGGNYGWNSREGFECYNYMCGRIGPEVLPIYAYDHTVGNCIIGGYVYRGCTNPNLQGLYFFADYGYGKLFQLREVNSTYWQYKEIQMCGRDVCFNDLTPYFETNILSFGEDYEGEVYILTTSYPSTQSYTGSIYTIVDPRRRGDPSQCLSSNQASSTPSTATTTTTTTTASSSFSTPTITTTTTTTRPTPTTTTTTRPSTPTTTTTTRPSTPTTTTTTTPTTTTTATTTTTKPTTTTTTTKSATSTTSSTTIPTTTTTTIMTPQSTRTTTTTTTTRSPYSNGFSTTTQQQSVGYYNWSCNFELANGIPDWCGMVQATDDNFNWTIFNQPTPSDPTGPDFAFSGQWYIYIEASAPRQPNDTAKIYIPSPPNPGNYCLSFHYHMFGFHIRELQVFRESPGNSVPETIWRVYGQKGNIWLFAQFMVQISQGQKIGFIGVRGDEYSGDIALDAISLNSGTCS